MKRFLLALLLAACLALDATAAVTTLFTARTTTGASSSVDTARASYVRVHVYRSDNASASTAVVLIQQSLDATTWYTVATVTNPTGADATTGSGGELWSIPTVAYTRVYLSSRAAGSISAKIEVAK